MTDLVSRLLEAIEETERLAQAAYGEVAAAREDGVSKARTPLRTWFEHANHHRPSSVLRRCAADRRTVEEWLKQVENPFNGLSHDPPYFIGNLAEAYGLEVTE